MSEHISRSFMNTFLRFFLAITRLGSPLRLSLSLIQISAQPSVPLKIGANTEKHLKQS